MPCERCNRSDQPTNRCLVTKPGGEVVRRLCKACRTLTRQVYPVTVLADPQDAEETRQDGQQTASAETAAPKGRTPRATHMVSMDGLPFCRQVNVGRGSLTAQRGDVTCRRCLAKL